MTQELARYQQKQSQLEAAIQDREKDAVSALSRCDEMTAKLTQLTSQLESERRNAEHNRSSLEGSLSEQRATWESERLMVRLTFRRMYVLTLCSCVSASRAWRWSSTKHARRLQTSAHVCSSIYIFKTILCHLLFLSLSVCFFCISCGFLSKGSTRRTSSGGRLSATLAARWRICARSSTMQTRPSEGMIDS